jgi:hypothetical protein
MHSSSSATSTLLRGPSLIPGSISKATVDMQMPTLLLRRCLLDQKVVALIFALLMAPIRQLYFQRGPGLILASLPVPISFVSMHTLHSARVSPSPSQRMASTLWLKITKFFLITLRVIPTLFPDTRIQPSLVMVPSQCGSKVRILLIMRHLQKSTTEFAPLVISMVVTSKDQILEMAIFVSLRRAPIAQPQRQYHHSSPTAQLRQLFTSQATAQMQTVASTSSVSATSTPVAEPLALWSKESSACRATSYWRSSMRTKSTKDSISHTGSVQNSMVRSSHTSNNSRSR